MSFEEKIERLLAKLESLADIPTKHDLQETERKIMSQLTDWAATENADLTAINANLNAIVTTVANLSAHIAAFNNSPGTLSASDQAAIDAIKATSDTLVTQSAAIVPAGTPVPAIKKQWDTLYGRTTRP
jgi:pectin methylesterase-like acyl-CoA thioesterase